MKKDNPIIGNIGIYYTRYRLSKMNWIIMPAFRNGSNIVVSLKRNF